MEEVLVCAKGQCVVLVQSKFGELKPPCLPQVNKMDRENKLRQGVVTHVLPVQCVRFTSLASLSSSAIATATKTSLESKHLRSGDYFVP